MSFYMMIYICLVFMAIILREMSLELEVTSCNLFGSTVIY